MRRLSITCLILVLAFLVNLVSFSEVIAYWQEDGIAVSTALDDQLYPQLIADGAGGTIITWFDQRYGGNDIFAQCVDAFGSPVWATDGVPICTYSTNQEYPRIISDDVGGAIIVWDDFRNGDRGVYAQRVDQNGDAAWSVDGIEIRSVSVAQNSVRTTSDGAGGAIVVWQDERSGYDIYAQHVNAAGAVQWTVNGIAICQDPAVQTNPSITSDGDGGAIIAWQDGRDGGGPNIYAARISSGGVELWCEPICEVVGSQEKPDLASDGAGGAIITWQDYRNAISYDIYAQRVDHLGIVQWTTDGVGICLEANTQNYQTVISDDAGGAIIAWDDQRGGGWDIYAQRVDAVGTRQWMTNGAPVCMAANAQWTPRLVSDGASGAIISWFDQRSGGDYDIYAQRIDANGAPTWTLDGIPICSAAYDQLEIGISSDGAGGAFLAWHDYRSGSDYDIYADRIGGEGQTGNAPVITSVKDVPKDEGGKVSVVWSRSGLDATPFNYVTHYSVWRSLSSEALLFLEASGAREVSPAEIAPSFSGPAYRYTSTADAMYAWEWLANLPAHYFPEYSYAASTLFDSLGSDPGYHYFLVSAHTSDPFVFFDSEPDSGYSVDNLSPCMPMGLAGEGAVAPPGLILTWEPNDEPDFSYYAVYSGPHEEFIPGPGNLLFEGCDTVYVDDDPLWGGNYYKVSAIDIHGNESPFALLRPEDVTGANDPHTPQASFLAQNFPNPFNPTTQIRFGLHERAHVFLGIFDVQGRLIRILTHRTLDAGRYFEAWDGTDTYGNRAASGVYFYEMKAGSFIETRKMILLQ